MEFAETSHHITPSIHTYYIQAHGAIPLLSGHNNNIVVITIPDNIELFTYASLGKVAHSSCNTLNYVCKKQYDEHRGVQPINTPVYKYKQKFPQIILGPDVLKPEQGKTQITGYTGIMHCIPKSKRDPTKKGQKTKEVIHNIDTNPLTDCSDGLIHPTTFRRVYKANTNYSEYYKTVLTTNQASKKREPPLNLINKCGMLFLSEAIEIVNQHCRETYKEDYSKSIIQIHLTACLVFAENPIDYNAGMKTVNDLRYFTSNSSNIDPKIKDTSHIKTYTFTFGKKVFIIEVPKSKSKSKSKSYTGDGINIHENNFEKKLFSALLNALKIINIKDIDLLPDEITLSIPEGRTMKEEDIKNYILDILNKLIRDSKKMKKLDFLWDKIGRDPIAWDAIEKELDEKERRLEEKEERFNLLFK
jgi:hypothetical protein